MPPVAEKTTSPAPADRIADGGAHDLGRRTARGGAIVFAAMLLQKALGLGILAILARLLTPEDYGLFGMVLAMTAFLGIFQDLGLGLATVQRADLTHPQVSTLFWINLGFGLLLSVLAAASAPLVAAFYGEPKLVSITLWCALGFTLAALGTQPNALLQRRMQFGRLALCQAGGLLVGGALGIGMALRGYGVHALVAQTLGAAGAGGLLSWVFAAWVPGRPVRGSGVRGMLRFGGYLTAFNVLNYFARNLDKVLLGRFWGAAPLGLYTRAYGLMTLPIGLVSGPMGSVMIPALAKLQHDKVRYAEAHLRTMRILALVSFPVAGILVVLADEVVALVYGPKWSAAVPIFRVLCFAGMFQAWTSSLGWLYTSAGKTREMFLWGTIGCSALALGLVPCIWFGPMGAAVGFALVFNVFVTPVGCWYATRCVGIPLRPLVLSALGPLLATAFVCTATLLVKTLISGPESLVLRVPLLLLVAGLSFAVGARILAPRAFREAITSAQNLLRHPVP